MGGLMVVLSEAWRVPVLEKALYAACWEIAWRRPPSDFDEGETMGEATERIKEKIAAS